MRTASFTDLVDSHACLVRGSAGPSTHQIRSFKDRKCATCMLGVLGGKPILRPGTTRFAFIQDSLDYGAVFSLTHSTVEVVRAASSVSP